jgi:hypothetical protein
VVREPDGEGRRRHLRHLRRGDRAPELALPVGPVALLRRRGQRGRRAATVASVAVPRTADVGRSHRGRCSGDVTAARARRGDRRQLLGRQRQDGSNACQ